MARRNKYGAVKVRADGRTFDSKREFARYCELKDLQLGGEIEGLELQPRFPIRVGGLLVCTYVGDFRYLDRRTGETVIEDVKGVRTDLYKLKKKLLRACHGIEITEVA